MEHTPYGYDIIGGRAVINKEKAEIIKRICQNYLNGMSFVSAAEKEGLTMKHASVKRLMQNRRYLGDSFYPAILTAEIMSAVENERLRREKAFGRNRRGKKEKAMVQPVTKFSIPRVMQKYDDPIRQAEYAYSLIRSEVSG